MALYSLGDISNFFVDNPEFIEPWEKYKPNLDPTNSPTSKFNLLKYLVYCIIAQAINWQTLGYKMFTDLQLKIGNKPWIPENLLAIKTDEYIDMSFSNNKIHYIRALCIFMIESKDLLKPLEEGKMSSKQILDLFIPDGKRTRVLGCGPFTIKYYLWGTGHPDIALYEDICVRKGMKVVYGLDHVPTLVEAKKLTTKWGSKASIATCICYAACQ